MWLYYIFFDKIDISINIKNNNMEKSTIYLIIAIVTCLTILGVSAEFFTYKYYELTLEQKTCNKLL